ncbi:MAG: papain-like cysteine protease family protein, partial [Bdellovibrio sp.]
SNPNDLPWMLQWLAPEIAQLKTTTYLVPEVYSQKNESMVDDFHQKAISSLSAGKPMIVQLLYTNPSFSHAVVITGIERQASSNSNLNIRILDPMTGKESFASVTASTGKLGDTNFKILKFSDPDVTSQDGFLLSISL